MGRLSTTECTYLPTLTERPKLTFEILCRQVSPHFIMKAPGSGIKPYYTIPCHAEPAMPWLDETGRASARAGGGGCNGSVGVLWQWTRATTSKGRAKGATLRKHTYSLANHHAAT